MIVKDEHDNLARCLESIEGFADEIVVYDTGSSDDTVAIARAAGAEVYRGYWDDDFGRARNDALEHCRGQWIVWVDADESLVCDDRASVRERLRNLTSEIEGYIVLIENLNRNEAAVSFTHPACRLFRRAYGNWSGHLHEIIVPRAGTSELARERETEVTISHRGYLQTAIAGRSKGQRNVRTAFGDLAGGSDLEWAFRLTSLGRSYAVLGQLPEAIEHCRRASYLTEDPSTARLALRSLVDCLLAQDDTDEALKELARLRAIPGSQEIADILEGRIRQARGEWDEALACFSRISEMVDEDGFAYSHATVAAPTAEILAELERFDEAVNVLLESIKTSGGVDLHIGTLIDWIKTAGRDPAEIYEALGSEHVKAFVPQLLQLKPDVADWVIESWLHQDPGSRLLLAAGSKVARRLEISRQLVWSARLRDAGLAASCPLVAAASDDQMLRRDRVLAAAAAATMWGDPRGRQALGAAMLTTTSARDARVGNSEMLSDDDGSVDENFVNVEIAGATIDLADPGDADPGNDGPGDDGPGDDSPVDDSPVDDSTLVAEVSAINVDLGRTARALAASRSSTLDGVSSWSRRLADVRTGRKVLVVDRYPCGPRTLGLVAVLARAGHQVTLVQPLPAAASIALLAPIAVEVRGWHEELPEAETWKRGCGAVLAWTTAERPFDTVVVRASAKAMVSRVRSLLPHATIVIDPEGRSGNHGDDEDVDVDDRAASSAARAGTLAGPVNAGPLDVLPRRPSVPLEDRAGICILGSLRNCSSAVVNRLVDDLAPKLIAACDRASIALCVDDPEHKLATSMPRALNPGLLADPSPWIACARAVLVVGGVDLDHHLAAANRYGTPALVVPEDETRTAEVTAALAALATDDSIWQQIAPVPEVPPVAANVTGVAELGQPDASSLVLAPLVPIATLSPLGQLAPQATLTPIIAVPIVAASGVPSGAMDVAISDPLAYLPAPTARIRDSRVVQHHARPTVRLVGGIFGLDSLSQVNREIATHLAHRRPAIDVSVVTRDFEKPTRDVARALEGIDVTVVDPRRRHELPAVDIEIRHQWPPDFEPVDGRLVLIQPWEFGGIPAEWIAPLRDVVDELWVPTSWVKQCAQRSGVDGDKVFVVPNGVDTSRFRPEGRPYPLATTKSTKFLFVGGLIERKGVDALLESYLSEFSAADDVCLVIKPFGSDTVYRTSTLEREIRQAASGSGADIEIVDGDLSFDDMAALYRSCDALVHPYRGEGFGLPIAEAMASGLPVIVSDGGACLDFCDERNAWLVGAREVPIASGEWVPTSVGTWWLEPDRGDIASSMRAVAEDPETAKIKGAVGRQRIMDRFTWDLVAEQIAERLSILHEEQR